MVRMSLSELRRDYILDRWVVIAPHRRKRPTDFAEKRAVERGPTICPFCPGNEHMTPPASLVYVPDGAGGVKREEDRGDARHKNWVVRCFPNLYPAFSSDAPEVTSTRGILWRAARALGHHEVLVESPNHDEHPGVARVSQLVHVVNAIRDRVSAFMAKDYVKYVSVFRNHGSSAGASLSHPHMQIIAMPIAPKVLSEEMDKSREYYVKHGRCIFCDIINEERRSERLIYEDHDFVIIAPWASINPFEFWIMPKRHQPTILDLKEDEVRSFALTLRLSLGGLRSLLNDPPYNFGLHMAPSEYYHWHLEVYPALSIWAGLEKSMGVYINSVTPEEAAGYLREVIVSEKRILG